MAEMFTYNVDTVILEILTHIIKTSTIERQIDYEGNYLYKMPNLEIRDTKVSTPIITFYNKTFTTNDRQKGKYFTDLVANTYKIQLETKQFKKSFEFAQQKTR